MTRSADYDTALKATQEFHTKQKGFNGRFLLRYVEDVRAIALRHECRSMLDYGCGRGAQYEGQPIKDPFGGADPQSVSVQDYLGITSLTKYDPGYPPFAADPVGKFDLVICTQVLGSIPVGDLPWVIERICNYSTKAVYFAEALVTAPRKQLHRNLKGKMPHGWTQQQWADAIGPVTDCFPDLYVYLRTKDKTVPKGIRIVTAWHEGVCVSGVPLVAGI